MQKKIRFLICFVRTIKFAMAPNGISPSICGHTDQHFLAPVGRRS
ncbi:hypothetical protein [Paenibacillus silviterrae]|nr:hypothetical protein [Paenibacillus chinjuensis]